MMEEKPGIFDFWGFRVSDENRRSEMFTGMFARKPDKAKAMKEHVLIFGVWVTAIRATPYVLHYLSGEKDEFKLEF